MAVWYRQVQGDPSVGIPYYVESRQPLHRTADGSYSSLDTLYMYIYTIYCTREILALKIEDNYSLLYIKYLIMLSLIFIQFFNANIFLNFFFKFFFYRHFFPILQNYMKPIQNKFNQNRFTFFFIFNLHVFNQE